MKRTITPLELAQRLKQKKPLILDVRRPANKEADPSQVPGATWRDPAKINEWVEAVPADVDVVLYCNFGRGISNTVVDALHARGVKACFIDGGLTASKEQT